ncbi:hypothetical protein E8E11_007578 [Didymella keratinophila]|nr:hypothetical protein E8E11_007578 [Didymella keratinophila]
MVLTLDSSKGANGARTASPTLLCVFKPEICENTECFKGALGSPAHVRQGSYYVALCGSDIDLYDKYFNKTPMQESLQQRSRVEEMSHGGPPVTDVHYLVDWPEVTPVTGTKSAVPFSQ